MLTVTLTVMSEHVLGKAGWIMVAVDLAVSTVVLAALFGVLFRVLPDARLAWRDVLFGDTAHLASILRYHIVDMNEDEQMVMEMNGSTFTTENGAALAVMVSGNTVKVGDATIVKPDLVASNGVIHVIDKLLTPPG